MALEDYNWADRMVHRFAFGARAPQDMLCDLEARMHGERIAAQPMGAPIFVTALPRAGTTLLLEVLSRHPALVTHSYRDMPFVLSPVMWRRFSGRFQVRQDAKERAHKDGLLVSVDSPEAFEEVLWMRHFPDHYSDRGIALWHDLDKGFTEALRWHMRALIVSRDRSFSEPPRYLSKNNANVARLSALTRSFPHGRMLFPLRHPLDQALSLLRQHELALQAHAQSRFVRDYVRDIGHFEFGANHRPILFAGMDEVIARHDPRELDYWLGYWIAAHRHVLEQKACEFIDMERFTNEKAAARLWDLLGLGQASTQCSEAEAMIRPINRREASTGPVSALLAEACAIYEAIRRSDACII
jgi:hypothetical protein